MPRNEYEGISDVAENQDMDVAKGPNVLSAEELARVTWHAGEADPEGEGYVEIGEVNDGTGRVAMRHSKDPDGTVIVYTREEWDAFIGGAKDGEFDFFDE